MKVQVFSPHFDDASLSCGEHILRWRNAAIDVEVLTVFSEFGAKHLSFDSQEFMEKAGITSVDAFRDQRAAEDKKSMSHLKVKKVRLLSLTDAGFREQHNAPTYRDHKVLFDGKILDSQAWQTQFKETLSVEIDADALIAVPLGVGQHADHLLVRKVIEELVPKERMLYYVDIPYAFKLNNWSFRQLSTAITSPKSLKWSSATKIAAVHEYTSQVPILFPEGLWKYPECVMGQPINDLKKMLRSS